MTPSILPWGFHLRTSETDSFRIICGVNHMTSFFFFFGLNWAHYTLPVIQMLLQMFCTKKLQHAFSSVLGWPRMEAVTVECIAYCLPTASSSFLSSYRVVLSSWATLLTNVLAAQAEVLQGALMCGQLIVGLCSFHLQTMVMKWLIRMLRSWEVS